MLISSLYRLGQVTVISLLSVICSCQNQNIGTEVSRESSELGPCDVSRKTVKVARNVQGRVRIFDIDHPNLWVIVSQQGIIGQTGPIFDGPDIVVPCNLPDNMKQNGLLVVFSGDLKDSKNELPTLTNKVYYSQLTNLQLILKN